MCRYHHHQCYLNQLYRREQIPDSPRVSASCLKVLNTLMHRCQTVGNVPAKLFAKVAQNSPQTVEILHTLLQRLGRS